MLFTFLGFLFRVRTVYLLNTWHTRVTVPGKAQSYCPAVSRLSHTHTHTHTHTHSSYGVNTKMEVQPFPAQWSFCIPPCLWQSVVGLSPRLPKFEPRSVHMILMVDKVALWQVFLPALLFAHVSIVPPMLHTHSFTYHPRYIMCGWGLKSSGCDNVSLARSAQIFTFK